ncbi:hypothetical protein [Sphingomonas sp.]|uniref:hypothetical protein n=1 Tax=Sphingomonas sp. TaxID=28214 RepID=UPI00307D51D9
MTDTLERREAIIERPLKLTMPNGDTLTCEYPKSSDWAKSWTSSDPEGRAATGEQDWEVVERYGLTAILEAALTTSPRVDEGRAREVLAEALEENDQFASAEGARNGAIGSWFVPSFVVIRAMIRFATEASAYPRKLEEDLAEAQKVMRAAHDNLIELNPNNYTHDDVCAANDSAVEAILLLADALGETHGKTPEWWAERRSRLTGGE